MGVRPSAAGASTHLSVAATATVAAAVAAAVGLWAGGGKSAPAWGAKAPPPLPAQGRLLSHRRVDWGRRCACRPLVLRHVGARVPVVSQPRGGIWRHGGASSAHVQLGREQAAQSTARGKAGGDETHRTGPAREGAAWGRPCAEEPPFGKASVLVTWRPFHVIHACAGALFGLMMTQCGCGLQGASSFGQQAAHAGDPA